MTVLNGILSFFKWTFFNRERNVVTDVVMALQVRAKMLCNVWSYDFYDMTLSTE